MAKTKANARAKGKGKPKVRFSNKTSTSKRTGSPSGSDSEAPGRSCKKSRTAAGSESASASGSTSGGPTGNPTDSSQPAGAAPGNNVDGDNDDEPKRVHNSWGIRSKEVPKAAKPTQKAFQRVIRAMCGLLTQNNILPSAIEARTHYDKRFDPVDNYRLHMRRLMDESRTAVKEALDRATKLIKDAKTLTGPIANDIARIPADHLATVFTMVSKAGLQGFIPDVEGPVQSHYNQLHRHLAVSAFQFLTSSFALYGLNVNNNIAQNHELLTDMFNNFVYGTLAQNTRRERRNPGSLSQSLINSVAYKARTRLGLTQFTTAKTLNLRKPVLRMAFVKESHSDDEHTPQGHRVRDKPGRSPVAGKFFVSEIDVKTAEYRKRNPVRGQKKPEPRNRESPLLEVSEISLGLPPDVPIDFFTPTFYNSLTVKERASISARKVYLNMQNGRLWVFIQRYGNKVLKQYNLPSEEELAALSDSDADDKDEEYEEINLADTDSEMEVDDELNG
ncbi:hypothetical protein C8R43DRAFT_948456 [Mycena crocata]|nr:hypothetical protein C8R43DRAFT_948456 [Mycena crocata]